MHKSLFAFAALAAGSSLALAGYDGAGTITQNAYSFGNGGEFTITPTLGFIGLTGLGADLSANSFETFCVEANENFGPGGNYNMDINVVAVLGGSGGPSYPLDPRTAFLYDHFRRGILNLFDYSPAGRQASAGDLQAAIWYIQGNQAGGANNIFVAMANAAVSSGYWSGIGDVRILNVYDADGNRRQDQLTLIPTPGAAALFGAGLVASARRRRA